jgi:hypothetical protein
MDTSETFPVNQQVSWQITQSQKGDGSHLPAMVTSQGRRYEWKQEEASPARKLLDLARSSNNSLHSMKSNQATRETLTHLTKSNCLDYERRAYDPLGSLSSLVRRFLPLSSLDFKEESVLSHIEGWSIDHANLGSLSSLKLIEEIKRRTANYTVYISASKQGEAAALRLCKMIDSIGPEWGIHSSFLSYSESSETVHYNSAIDNADLFIALVDEDYGMAGTRSQLELQYAHSLNSRKSSPWISAVYLDVRRDWVTEILANSPSLFLHGKNPKEYLERIATFMLGLLIRKKRREQMPGI